jgi:hypothetical protein
MNFEELEKAQEDVVKAQSVLERAEDDLDIKKREQLRLQKQAHKLLGLENPKEKWHVWFAWYPVFTVNYDHILWLKRVERKIAYGEWVYRKI